MTLEEHLKMLKEFLDEDLANTRTELLERVAEAETQGNWRSLEYYRPRLAEVEETIKRRAAANIR